MNGNALKNDHIKVTNMHVYHRYTYCNFNYYFDWADVNRYIMYYDGKFKDLDELHVYIKNTCYCHIYCDPSYDEEIHIQNSMPIPADANAPEIKDNVWNYIGHFYVKNKYIECCYFIYKDAELANSKHPLDLTRLNIGLKK